MFHRQVLKVICDSEVLLSAYADCVRVPCGTQSYFRLLTADLMLTKSCDLTEILFVQFS